MPWSGLVSPAATENLTARGSVNAIIFGGSAGHDTLTVASGASGNNILIGNGTGDTLTDNGSGHNILIGAGGATPSPATARTS
jgi:hypothetical protein